MAKYKYVLVGPEIGAGGVPVTKELVTYAGDYLALEDGFVKVCDDGANNYNVAVIRLAEGQSIKKTE